MSNRLTGNTRANYIGTAAYQPPDCHFFNRDPNAYDAQGYSLMDLWLNELTMATWILVNLHGTVNSRGQLATWVQLTGGGGGGSVTEVFGGVGINITGPATVAPVVNLNVPVIIANGGTNATAMANVFGVNYFDGTSIVTTAVGLAGQVLTSNGVGLAPTFQNAAGSVTQFTADFGGVATPTLGNINIFGGSNVSTTVGPSDTITIDVTGNVAIQFDTDSGTATPALGILQVLGATGISTSGAGNVLTISNSGGGIAWVEVTGLTQIMAIDTGYVANNAAQVNLTLPDTAPFGSVVRIAGKGAGGWKLSQNAGETIYFGAATTTPGVGGSLASTHRRDTVELVCITANTEWEVLSSVGYLTVV